jgi:hypothetical protein
MRCSCEKERGPEEPSSKPFGRSAVLENRSIGSATDWIFLSWRSELEVATDHFPTARVTMIGGQDSGNSPQGLPSGVVQRRIRADQVANHLPGRYVEGAFWGRAHGQRNRALGAERDPLRSRLLARPNSHGLRKHIHGN